MIIRFFILLTILNHFEAFLNKCSTYFHHQPFENIIFVMIITFFDSINSFFSFISRKMNKKIFEIDMLFKHFETSKKGILSIITRINDHF
jgi:hypothetical protein